MECYTSGGAPDPAQLEEQLRRGLETAWQVWELLGAVTYISPVLLTWATPGECGVSW